ncbi:MAG TPA: hypothetical protein VFX33_15495, partial [Actinomycetales bacterium]|nr:hypothetical protein [Actinomycetales bacterium]
STIVGHPPPLSGAPLPLDRLDRASIVRPELRPVSDQPPVPRTRVGVRAGAAIRWVPRGRSRVSGGT